MGRLHRRRRRAAWAHVARPDGSNPAFLSAVAGPETDAAAGNPLVISRYLYKPTATEGLTHFNDNKRLHIHSVDIASEQVRQLTTGSYDEHSIDRSPNGEEIVFASNRESNSDEFFNYDLFALKVSDGSIRRITATESTEYVPNGHPTASTLLSLGLSAESLTVRPPWKIRYTRLDHRS